MDNSRKNIKGRINYLDYIRTFAILLVIGIHSPIPVDNANGLIYSFVTVLCTPCNALFFMVSGALLLPMKEESWKPFLKRRLSKVLIPLLFWSVFTLFVQYVEGVKTLSEVLKDFCLLPLFPHANYNFWFVYVLTGLYLLTPIISSWIKASESAEIRYFLYIWLAALLCMMLSFCNVKMPKSVNGTLYYFNGWGGCFILGYYLHKYEIKGRIVKWIPLILLPFAVYLGLKYLSIDYDYQEILGYISLLTILSAASWFTILKKMDKHRNWIEMASNLSFGVYLCHTFFRDYLVCKIPAIYNYGSLVLVISIWVLTAILSFCFVYFASKLPYSHYIIGYSSRK